MSHQVDFRKAGPVQATGLAKVGNFGGVTDHLPSAIDPRLLSISDADFEYTRRNTASSSVDQSTSILQSSCTYEPLQQMGTHRNPPSRSATRSVGSESQRSKRSTRHRHRRRPNSDSSKHAASLQSPSPIKKYPNRRPRRTKAMYSATTADTPELSTSAESDGLSASVVDPEVNIRCRNGAMEWYDDQDFRWKPARYHRECRIELIKDAAQQPGAPTWTPDMGVNYTSFSPVTQGWNSDPSSVVDSQGRQIFSITTPPENWTILPPYGPLIHRGCVLLDHKSQPVRDIPGLPLTLSTSVEGWFLGGLRRCIQLEMRDIMARLPPTRVAKNNRIRPSQRDTSMTQRISRWLAKNEIPEWYPRGRSRETEQASATKINVSSCKVNRKSKQRRARPELDSSGMETDVTDYEPHLSTWISDRDSFEPDSTQVRPGSYTSGNEDAFQSPWDTTPSVGLGGHAGIHYPPISSPYQSPGFEYPPPTSSCYFEGAYPGMRKVARGIPVDHNTPLGEPYHYTGMSDPLGEPESLPTIDPPLNYHLSGNIDPQHNLFIGGNFPFNQPHTTAEMGPLQHPHDLTHPEYDPWLAAEAPENLIPATYAEQHYGIHTHLEQTWPYSSI